MAENPLRQLEACGTALWSDYIRRTFITNGELKRLVEQDGLSGVTSNPTIFEKAIGGSPDYDDDMRKLLAAGKKPSREIFLQLASTDVRMAADVLRPVYQRTSGQDGFVSIEVSPEAAHDTARTIEDAHTLWQLVDRPNIMIKVPATSEGLPAIEQLIGEGINVNITLLFAVEVYAQVIEAYLRGLEQRVKRGQDVSQIASVASFFVSRVDTLVDRLLEQKISTADRAAKQELEDLQGKAAVANARLAYEQFETVFGGTRFGHLQEKGAQIQRVLWASTSSKNPNFPDTKYVETLVGKHTVNTMPPHTIVAVRDHGHIECDAVRQNLDDARQLMKQLKAAGIDMKAVTDQLTAEGVDLFTQSLHQLFAAIEQKSAIILAGEAAAEKASLNGQQDAVNTALQEMTKTNFVRRLWDKDPALWKPDPRDQDEISIRLGWLHVSDCMLEQKERFADAAKDVREAGFSHAVVLGLGGSSLAPYVLVQSFGLTEGFPELLVLDSTDPQAIRDVEEQIDLSQTLFIVSSKSGTTTEPLAFFKTFWEKVRELRGDQAGSQFIAITDPGTALEGLAREQKFRYAYLNPADIGGRYSALSYFGLIPAAVMGIDVEKLLDRAQRMEQACAPSLDASDNPGAWLGTIMGMLAKSGRDKVTFFLSPQIETFGLWLEQLLAESTGKEGKGLVPVPDNPPGEPRNYADDHLFVYIRLNGDDNSILDEKVRALETAVQPVVRVRLEDLYDLAAEFFRWEFATAVAGALLGINAFDQPNVQESKDNTKRLLGEFASHGRLPEAGSTLAQENGISVLANDIARAQMDASSVAAIQGAIGEFLKRIQPPRYVGIMAYLSPDPSHDGSLKAMRVAVRDALRVATTFGYGPRFLHSTGQLHKGGPPEGVFLQITAKSAAEVPVPGEQYGYETLIRAQALGDFEALQKHGRPVLRVELPDESANSMRRLLTLLQSCLGGRLTAAV